MNEDYIKALIKGYIKKANNKSAKVICNHGKGSHEPIKNNVFAENILDEMCLPKCRKFFELLHKKYPFNNDLADINYLAVNIFNDLYEAKQQLQDEMKNKTHYTILKEASTNYYFDTDKYSADNILPLVDTEFPFFYYEIFLYNEMLIERNADVDWVLRDLYKMRDTEMYELLDFYDYEDGRKINDLRQHLIFIDDFINHRIFYLIKYSMLIKKNNPEFRKIMRKWFPSQEDEINDFILWKERMNRLSSNI